MTKCVRQHKVVKGGKDYDDNKIEEFYDQLQNVIDQTPEDILVVQGAWNAKVGRDACGNCKGIC